MHSMCFRRVSVLSSILRCRNLLVFFAVECLGIFNTYSKFFEFRVWMNIICYLIMYYSPNTQCLLGGIMLKMFHINTVIVQLYNAFDSRHCYIRDQIWPCRKIGHGQPRIIIWANLVVLEHLASHGDSIWNLASTDSVVSEEKMFKKCGRRTDGRRRPTYPISSPSAQVS